MVDLENECCAETVDSQTGIRYADIPGYPHHRAGSDGSIVSYLTGEPCTLSHRYRGTSTLYVRMRAAGGYRRDVSVPGLVLGAFVGPRPLGTVACHINGDHRDNRLENLKWGRNPTARAIRWLDQPAYKDQRRKLTADDVRSIRRMNAEGATQTRIATLYGVSQPAIHFILVGRTWRHVEDESPTSPESLA